MNSGDVLGHYRILGPLGSGGMGEVYKAEDTRLKRVVAIKVLTAALGEQAEAKQRLIAEAQAASALDHPNICTIYEIDETADGRVFLVMAHYDGETLAHRISRGVVPVGEAVEILIQLTRAVAAAHQAGVIHRDIKPANVFVTAKPVTDASRVKLLDFGIAKLADQTALTRTGTTIGTIAYMAPEHVAGHAIDHRADIWSLGVVLYELVAGHRPFDASNPIAAINAIANDNPPPLGSVRADVPPSLDAVAQRALRKRADDRYQTARQLLDDLEAARHAVTPSLSTATQTTMIEMPRQRRMARWVMAGATAAVVIAAGWWMLSQRVRANEISQTVEDLRAMIESEKYSTAFRRLHTLRPEIAADAAVAKASRDYFLPLRITTDPPGAEVEAKGYDEPDAAWIPLGASPIDTRASIALYRWRIKKSGFETFEGSGPPGAGGEIAFTLVPSTAAHDGMVRVPGGTLPDFFIDKYEVTNKAYKKFIDAGGYRNASYWPATAIKNGASISRDQLLADFRDATGRPGPASWELGTYPDGQDEFPVSGISWFEAAAYAKFAGKSLPTVLHWRQAAGQSIYSQILTFSNFSAKAPMRVGSLPSLGPYGTYDMAGNVKEWCENEVDGKRYTLGGGWNEPNYTYRSPDARSPFDRASNFGVRLILTPDPAAVPAAAHQPVPQLYRDYSREKPANNELFSAYLRAYAYDKVDPAGKTESVNETDVWRVERVSYAGAHNDRVPAYLFLPKNAKPPYQTVVYFPHSGGTVLDSFQQAEMAYLGFLVKSGRALLFPMYHGTYERRLKTPIAGPNEFRNYVIQQVQEVSRSLDYLATRSDIDAGRVAYFGVSLGAARAPIVLAAEHRFKTAIMWSGGLPSNIAPTNPEVDPINFAPRATTPVLMLNGRDDFTFPVESSQEPLYRLFGTAASDKGRGVYEGGHVFPFSRMIKDSLDWLDKYLGAPN